MLVCRFNSDWICTVIYISYPALYSILHKIRLHTSSPSTNSPTIYYWKSIDSILIITECKYIQLSNSSPDLPTNKHLHENGTKPDDRKVKWVIKMTENQLGMSAWQLSIILAQLELIRIRALRLISKEVSFFSMRLESSYIQKGK